MSDSNSQSAYLKYTAPIAANGSTPAIGPTIGYFSDSACTKPWIPREVTTTQCKFYIHWASRFSRFAFYGITFWAKEAKGDDYVLASHVAQTFPSSTAAGSAKFNSKEYVSGVHFHNPGTDDDQTISFVVTNRNGKDDSGAISFQITIEDENLQALYTSVDPQIPLPKPTGG